MLKIHRLSMEREVSLSLRCEVVSVKLGEQK